MAKAIGRKWLWCVFAVPVAFAGVAGAEPWLERSPTVGQGWEDIPFLGPPQRGTQQQKQPGSPETTRALDAKRELQRELHRMPEVNRAANPKPAANVFPSPRAPSAARGAPQPADARTVAPAPQPLLQSRTAAARTRDGEQELQRELQRTLPPTAVLPVGEPLACAERLARIARYSPLPSRAGPGACGGADLVRLESVVMPDRTTVALNPPPQIKCGMAEQFAQWIREDVGPAAAELGSPLLSISGNDAYDCRPRNNVKGAPLSEHGKGNALDITGIRLRNGGVFTLADQLVAKSFRDKVRLAACGRFMTVLGPGSDAYHGDHVHLDMAERARKTKVCQWNVRETVVASRVEPEPQQRAAASAPPVAVAPVVPPPPKVEAKIEPKLEPKVEPKLEPKIESKVEPTIEPRATAQAAAPAVEVKPSAAPEPAAQTAAAPPQAPPEPATPATPAVEALQEQTKGQPAQEPAIKERAIKEQVTKEEPPQEPSSKRDTQTSEVAAAPIEEQTGSMQPVEAPASQAAEPLQPSPPLPRRKPEALLTLAQVQQSETQNRAERAARPRYDSRRQFERDIRRFIRNFF